MCNDSASVWTDNNSGECIYTCGQKKREAGASLSGWPNWPCLVVPCQSDHARSGMIALLKRSALLVAINTCLDRLAGALVVIVAQLMPAVRTIAIRDNNGFAFSYG